MVDFNGQKWDSVYLNEIKNGVFKRMDSAGNKDGKVTIKEALNDLNIASLLSGQNEADTAKIKAAADKIPEVLANMLDKMENFLLKNGQIS